MGYATTKELLRLGATRVVMACRDVQRGYAARRQIAFELAAESPDGSVKPNEVEKRVCVRVLDLASLASVRTFADAFLREFDRLDVLILNAGLAREQYNTKFTISCLVLLCKLFRLSCAVQRKQRRGRAA